ncbi:MAG: hypothetical protein JST96_09470 [Bacteroidetes bacterium]|nr:hypothetical protein [Bacteroidota bacterium]
MRKSVDGSRIKRLSHSLFLIKMQQAALLSTIAQAFANNLIIYRYVKHSGKTFLGIQHIKQFYNVNEQPKRPFRDRNSTTPEFLLPYHQLRQKLFQAAYNLYHFANIYDRIFFNQL